MTEKLREKEATEGDANGAAAALPAVGVVRASVADDVEEPEPEPEPEAEAAAFEERQVKSEDRLSTGSGGSAVVDAADALLYNGRIGGAAVDSSVESYFPGAEVQDQYHGCGTMGPVTHGAGGIQSDDDDGAGSDEGCSYYADEEAAAAFLSEHTHHADGDDEDAGQISWWWMWN